MKVCKSELAKKIQSQNTENGKWNQLVAVQNTPVEVKIDNQIKKVSSRILNKQ